MKSFVLILIVLLAFQNIFVHSDCEVKQSSNYIDPMFRKDSFDNFMNWDGNLFAKCLLRNKNKYSIENKITNQLIPYYEMNKQYYYQINPLKSNNFSSKYNEWAVKIGYAPMKIGELKQSNNKQSWIQRQTPHRKSKVNETSNLDLYIFELNPDNNIYHQFYFGQMFCIVSLIEEIKNNNNYRIYLKVNSDKPNHGQIWFIQMIKLLTNHIVEKIDDYLYKAIKNTQCRQKQLIASHHYEIERKVVPIISSLNVLITQNLNKTNEKYILLIQRHPRSLIDSETGTFQQIINILSIYNIPIKVISFDMITPLNQANLMYNAAIVIGIHGAELTNILYMKPNTYLIEITLRYGWCCDPIPLININEYTAEPCICQYNCLQTKEQPKSGCNAYHKADYANLANSLGINYYYFDPIYTSPPITVNPIQRNFVYINSTELGVLSYHLWNKYHQKTDV